MKESVDAAIDPTRTAPASNFANQSMIYYSFLQVATSTLH